MDIMIVLSVKLWRDDPEETIIWIFWNLANLCMVEIVEHIQTSLKIFVIILSYAVRT